MESRDDRPFDAFVRDRTGADFVDRRWLAKSLESAAADDACRFVLLTGEPGVGKTTLACGLARDNDDWLRYFIGQPDNGVHAPGDVTSFLLSIGHQLAWRHPEAFDLEQLKKIVVEMDVEQVEPGGTAIGVTIDDLVVSPFHETAMHAADRDPALLDVKQRAGRVRGTMTGVRIGTARLEPRLLEPHNLAYLALWAPAKALLKQNPAARIVILLDALDDAARSGEGDGLINWLSAGTPLPPNVRVVITSRPHRALDLLRQRPMLTRIELDPDDTRVRSDLVEYAETALSTSDAERELESNGLIPDQFRQQVARHAAGNFQYLASYTRALNDASADRNDELIAKLLQLDNFGSDLADIYAFFAETARHDIEQLGLQPIEDPQVQEDRTPAWEGVGRRILGVLAVAREPLTVEQLTELSGVRVEIDSVDVVVSRMRWLLDRRNGRLAFFHESIAEFLVSERAAEQTPECHVRKGLWHRRITRHYRGNAATWDDVDWPKVDRYGLAHLAAHVERSDKGGAGDLVSLACPGLRQAIRVEFGNDRRFMELADRAAERVSRAGDLADGLAQVMYLGVIRHQGAQADAALPPRPLGLLARRGRLREALDRAATTPPSVQRFASILEILRHAEPGPGDPPVEDLVELLVENAVTVAGNSEGDRVHQSSAWEAMKAAALVLAPRNLERALRLWQRGLETVGSGKAGEPDPLYREAARAAGDPHRARELIGRIRDDRDRADACLDLADRAEAPRLPWILRAAEAEVARLGPAERLPGLARLAALWAPHDADEATRLRGVLRAETFEAAADKEFATHVAAAAEAIAEDRVTALLLLSTLDATVPGSVRDPGFLRGMELWTQRGEPARARSLADRLLAVSRSRDKWDRVRVLAVLGASDRATALALIEKEYAAIPAVADTAGMMENLYRDGDLRDAAMEFARHDFARAAEVAREISNTRWNGSLFDISGAVDDRGVPALGRDVDADRYSVLADIGHRCLDEGDQQAADRLLGELTDRSGDIEALTGTTWVSSCYARKRAPAVGNAPRFEMFAVHPIGERRPIRHYSIEGSMAIFNLSQDWAACAKRYFFRDPADVIRALRTIAGGPRSLARTVRTLAERDAVADLARARRLVRAITDPGERAIGLAGLHRAAHVPDHGPVAESLSRELDRALAELEPYRWLIDMGDTDARAWAYARPDYQVSFEVALRAYGCRPQDWQALSGLAFLQRAMYASMAAWASRFYAEESIARGRAYTPFAETHQNVLQEDRGDPLLDVARAQAAFQEFRISAAVPGYRSGAARVRIADPRYGAVVDLVTPAPGEPLSPEFKGKVGDMIAAGSLPAAAGLVAFGADARPEYSAEIRELGNRIIEAAGREEPARKVDTLSRLAEARSLSGLIDPAALYAETEQCAPFRHETWGLAGARDRLFPVLVTEDPGAALRVLYRSAAASWGNAMGLLEAAADPLTSTAGTPVAATLLDAIRRGLACMAPGGAAPPVVDGVRLDRLAGTSGERQP